MTDVETILEDLWARWPKYTPREMIRITTICKHYYNRPQRVRKAVDHFLDTKEGYIGPRLREIQSVLLNGPPDEARNMDTRYEADKLQPGERWLNKQEKALFWEWHRGMADMQDNPKSAYDATKKYIRKFEAAGLVWDEEMREIIGGWVNKLAARVDAQKKGEG